MFCEEDVLVNVSELCSKALKCNQTGHYFNYGYQTFRPVAKNMEEVGLWPVEGVTQNGQVSPKRGRRLPSKKKWGWSQVSITGTTNTKLKNPQMLVLLHYSSYYASLTKVSQPERENVHLTLAIHSGNFWRLTGN